MERFRLATEAEIVQLNAVMHGYERNGTVFCLENEFEEQRFYIVAKQMTYQFGMVYYYDRPNLQPGERIAEFVTRSGSDHEQKIISRDHLEWMKRWRDHGLTNNADEEGLGRNADEMTEQAGTVSGSGHVRLYDQHSVHTIDWPDTEDARYARAYLEPLMKHGTTEYMTNVNTTLLLARIDDLVLPVTVNEEEYDNAYVCSPYTHYVRYAKQELTMLQNRCWKEGFPYCLVSLAGA